MQEPQSSKAGAAILVVDDDQAVRDTISEMLKVEGHRCTTAASVSGALEQIARQQFDVIITDMHMPGQSGLDLIDSVQKIEDPIPVILITAYPSVHTAINAMKRGAVEFITKPFDFESISYVVAKALRERRLRQEVNRLQADAHKTEVIERLNRQLNARVEELTRLYTITEAMNQFMDSDGLFQNIVRLASEVTTAQRVSLMVLDRARENLKIRASIGLSGDIVAKTKVSMGESVSGKVAQEGRLVRANRQAPQPLSSSLEGLGLRMYSSNSWLSMPVMIGGRVFGVLNLTDKADRSDFTQEDQQIIQTLVEKAGTKLENQALYEGIYANILDTLNSLVTTIEAKDPYTREHSHRVTDYAKQIAECMKVSDEELEMIEFAGVLHDIGKIGVRDEILTKGGKLTAEEYDAIKQHVIIGDRIAEPLGLSPAERAIIRNHHEWFDGTGYPDKLAGNNIPLLARIVTVADAFDAMTSTRPYRKAMTREEAIGELNRLKGVQFDPQIVDAAALAVREGKIPVVPQNGEAKL